MDRGLRFFFFFPFQHEGKQAARKKVPEVQRYLLVGKRGRVKVSTGSLLCNKVRYVCIHVEGTYLPIPSRSGKDNVPSVK